MPIREFLSGAALPEAEEGGKEMLSKMKEGVGGKASPMHEGLLLCHCGLYNHQSEQAY